MTELPLVETEVRTLLFCSMSMRVAPDGPTVEPETVPADAPVKVTVPKLAKGTRELPSSKSSTIHSAFSWQSDGWPENVCETVWPVERFSSVAVPEVSDDAVTVTVISSPAASETPLKSTAAAGNHSNHARMGGRGLSARREWKRSARVPSKEVRLPETVKSTPVWRIAVWQVSPSIPTQAEDEWLPEPPEGSRGVGIVNVPVTDLNVFYSGETLHQHGVRSFL